MNQQFVASLIICILRMRAEQTGIPMFSFGRSEREGGGWGKGSGEE